MRGNAIRCENQPDMSPAPRPSTDVAIVGAGIIGLSIALELSRRGAKVAVFDRAKPASAASWAAAGMLAPYTEGVDDELTRLGARSLAMYPRFIDAIRRESGVDPHLRLIGIVSTAYDAASMERLAERASALVAVGVACDVLDGDAVTRLEPVLAGACGAILVRDEGTVDNRLIGGALVHACRAQGVVLVSEARSVRVELDDRAAQGVYANERFYPAAWVVIAAGAWSAAIDGVPRDALPLVEPVKGQMLAVTAPQRLLARPAIVPGAYLVPRDDGRVLIGATSERSGFDERVDDTAIAALRAAAIAAVPAISDCAVVETWCGLRPASTDGRPCIGPTKIERLVFAGAHYRNGILLAPITAHLLCDYLETRDASPLLSWNPQRFALQSTERPTNAAGV